MVHFYTVTSPQPAVSLLTARITDALTSGRKVLWLVSGGSTIAVSVAVMEALRNGAVAMDRLTIMQVDERYGDVGHIDSNWRQLQAAGFVTDAANALPLLRGAPLETTRQQYQAALQTALDTADFCIGLFGIGSDGHTAGILPNSPAAQPDAPLVCAYSGPDYVRLTITKPVFALLDCAIAYAVGNSKASTLQKLYETDTDSAEQPAQLLKQATETYIYNDYLEGDI